MIDQKYRVRVNREPLISGDKRTMRKKKLIVWSSIAGAVLLAVILGLILLGGRDAEPSTVDAPDLTLTIDRGDVQIKRASDEDFVPAADGMTVEPDSTVRTESDSRAVLELIDGEFGSAVRLDSNTRLEVLGLGSATVAPRLISGHVWVQTVGSTGAKNEVTTEIGRVMVGQTSESDGTAAILLDDEEETVRAIDRDSTVFIDEAAGGMILEEGQESTFDGENPPETQDDFETQEMDDDFVDSAWYRWNTEQDADFKARLAGDEDTDGPTLTISSPKDGDETEDEQIEIKGTTDVSATVTINGDEVETEDGEFSFEVDLDEGENEITIIATDPSGNETEKTLTITRAKAELDSVSFSLDASTEGSILVSWEVSEEDAFGSYVVKRDDATVAEISDRETTEYQDKDVEGGREYGYVVCVRDREGAEACASSQNVTVSGESNEAPSVSLTSPADEESVASGSAINFASTGSDPEGAALTYTWDFGDGGTATGQTVTHTYATTTSAKTLTVTVTVSDPDGKTDEASITITVTP